MKRLALLVAGALIVGIGFLVGMEIAGEEEEVQSGQVPSGIDMAGPVHHLPTLATADLPTLDTSTVTTEESAAGESGGEGETTASSPEVQVFPEEEKTPVKEPVKDPVPSGSAPVTGETPPGDVTRAEPEP